jgi:pilus assembly protein Flp/PilA
MTNLVKRFVKDESGATAIEYGLIAAGISVAIIAVVQGLGSKLNTTLGSVSTASVSAGSISIGRPRRAGASLFEARPASSGRAEAANAVPTLTVLQAAPC